MAAKFVYRGKDRTVESVTRKSQQSSGSFDSYLIKEAQLYKAKEGDCCVRILPPTWKDIEKYGDGWDLGVYVHFDVGPDNTAYLCFDKMKGEPCPVCEARRDAATDEESNALRPSLRSLAWVIDRDNEKAGPMIWAIPITLFREINARSIDKKTNTPILIDDPEEGYDIVFNRTGSSIKTKYTAVEVMRDPSPLHDDERQQDRWLEYIAEHPLPECLVFYDQDHVAKALNGKVDRRRDAEDDGEDTSVRRRASRRSAEPEAEADERPSRRARRPEPEVEEEEEERPSRTSRRGAAKEEEPSGRSGRRRQLLDDQDDDEAPFDEGSSEKEESTPSRRRSRPEPEEEDEESSEPVAAARRSLGRLRSRSRS